MTTYEITGQLIDYGTNEPLPFANIVPIDSKGKMMSSYGATSGWDGKFKLKIPSLDFGDGDYAPLAKNLRISFVGYKTKFVPIIVAKKYYKISLTSTAKDLGEVVIHGEHPRTTCIKEGGVYDEAKNQCKKKNRTLFYVGIGLAILAAIGGGMFAYKKLKE